MRILVCQQNGSGEAKIAGIREYGNGDFCLEVFSIDEMLPPLLDDCREYLPSNIRVDLVLDFLKHPDLSHDLARMFSKKNIPVVASGKKIRLPGVFTPPT